MAHVIVTLIPWINLYASWIPFSYGYGSGTVYDIGNQQSQYQRHLTPVGVRTIIKEEICCLPNGTRYELRDIWTADSTTEE
jgi:hypothetical protein